VLLIDARQFPRDKSCGDGLTRPAVALLEEMGVLPELSGAQRVRGVRVTMHGRGTRDYRYPEPSHGIVIPRLALDDILRRRTVEAGAELRERLSATRLIYSGGAVCGVELSDGTSLRASVVLAADGAASALARDAGLSTGAQMGFAIRGYYEGIGELDAMLEIKLPLMDPAERYLLPSYGWIFPTGPGTANIGIGLFRRLHGANLRVVMRYFVEGLRRSSSRFRECGPAERGRARRCAATSRRSAALRRGSCSSVTPPG
jgi:flavin-dependent dehydrogenase